MDEVKSRQRSGNAIRRGRRELLLRWGAAVAVAISLGGCASVLMPEVCVANVNDVGYTLAGKLYSGLPAEERDKPVIVTSIANLDDVNEVSPLGRLVSEHIGSRLAQLGAKVAEPRLRTGMAVTKTGEQGLSREAKDLAAKVNAFAFVTGTVTRMQGRYYFNARLVRVKDAQVLASYDLCLTGRIKEAGL